MLLDEFEDAAIHNGPLRFHEIKYKRISPGVCRMRIQFALTPKTETHASAVPGRRVLPSSS